MPLVSAQAIETKYSLAKKDSRTMLKVRHYKDNEEKLSLCGGSMVWNEKDSAYQCGECKGKLYTRHVKVNDGGYLPVVRVLSEKEARTYEVLKSK